MEKIVDGINGWFPLRTAPWKEAVYVGTEKMQVLAYKDENGQWRKVVCDRPLNMKPYQWKPRNI